MKSFTPLSLVALILALPIFANPITTPLSVKTVHGPVVPDSYIVVLKSTASKASHIATLSKIAARADKDASVKITHQYDEALYGYAATLRGASLQHVLASKDVEYVEQNGILPIEYQNTQDVHSEVAREEKLLNARASGGAGVDIYELDTGIYTAHSEFAGRASWGATFGGYASVDGNGHGTYMAAIAVGATYGVAKSANIIAVKVLSDSGSGATSDIISGVNYALSAFKASGRPSIVLTCLGGSASTALDSAISSAISSGLHFVVAGGSSNVDASTTSPARVAAANTVGTISADNVRASFSNYGSVIDIWAVGVSVKSAWIGSTTATNTISGVCASTAYVAGVLAIALGEYGQTTPASLSASLKSHGLAVVTGVPAGTTNLKAAVW